MNCREAQQLISCYLDGEISKLDRETLESHLTICSPCEEQMVSYKTLNENLDSFFEVPQKEAKETLSHFQFSFPHKKSSPSPPIEPLHPVTYLTSGMILGTAVTLFLIWLLTLKPQMAQMTRQNQRIMGLQKQISKLQKEFSLHPPSPLFPESGKKMERFLVQILKQEPSRPARIFVLSPPQKEKWQRWSRVHALVGCLEDPSPHVRIAVARKLKKITKEDLGYTVEFWKEGKRLEEAKGKWNQWCEDLAKRDGEFILELLGEK